MTTHDPYVRPTDRSVREDDGAADHLVGLEPRARSASRHLRRKRSRKASVPKPLTLYTRLTLLSENARIVKVFSPVLLPDEDADNVPRWLATR